MSKHTPGPWLEDGFAIRTKDGELIATMEGAFPFDEEMANARLVRAAPKLLEDGKKLCNELAGIMGAYELRDLLGNTNFTVLFERWEELRAAIQKAEGAQ